MGQGLEFYFGLKFLVLFGVELGGEHHVFMNMHERGREKLFKFH